MNINFKKLISALLVAVMVFCSAPLSGFVGLELPEFNLFKADAAEIYSGECGDNLTWEFDESTGTLTISGTGDMTAWATSEYILWGNKRSLIKTVIITDGVTSIGDFAFDACENLTSIKIPDSITTIRCCAFAGCESLTSVFIPDGVTRIEDSVFSRCKNLTDITIPDGVTSIGSSAFYGCRALKNITIPNSVTSIGFHAFEDCDSFESVTIPKSVTSFNCAFVDCDNLKNITVDSDNPEYSSDENGVMFNKDKTVLLQYPSGNTRTSYVIPDSVSEIGQRAFCGDKNLKNVTIGNNVYFLSYYSFADCDSLESITMGKNVVSINESFPDCENLKKLTVDSENFSYSSDEYGVLFNKDKTELIQYPTGNARTSYEIPDSVSKICFRAFDGSSFLETVTIPDSVTDISNSAFHNIKNLKHITIPDSVTTIGCSVFWGCDSLQYIHLPTSLTEIGDDILSWTKAYICAETEDSYAKTYADKNGIKFRVCEGIHYENLPEIITDKCGDNLTWTLNTKSGELIISGTGDMWESCTKIWYPYRDYIKTVVVEDGVTSIGKDAFHFFDNLRSITIPDSVTSIGDYAVMGCTNLETVTLGKGVKTIGEGGISLCIELDSLIIHEGVTAIGDWAFAYNSSLEYVHFPKSVTEIGENIFDTISPYICAETKDCYAKKYADKNGIEFRLCADHREVPDVNDKICGENLTWSLDIETGILTISGTGDMYNYSVSEAAPWYSHQPYIKSVVINDGVTSIGNYAFTDLPNLTKVTMADTVLTIGKSAFEDCVRLRKAEISKNTVSICENAFHNCESLTSAIIPDSVTNMGSSAFGFCDALESVIIGDGLESISGHCFYSCGKLEYIEIGSNVTKIGSNSFAWCDNLKTVVLPKSLESIAAYAFEFCNKLNSVYYEGTWEEWCEITFGYYNSDLLNASIYCNASAEDVPEDGSNPDNSGNKLEWNVNKSTGTLYINGTGAMDNYSGNVAPWYIYQSQVNTIVIGEGITSVGDYAFYDFVSVTDVILPESMINIGDHAFEDCEILEYINFGNKLKTIGDYAFCNCDNLRDVTIPNSVISLGASAFSFSGVENLSIGKGLKEISTYAFYDCDNLRNLIIGENVETISTEAFAISSNLKNVFIPSDVTKIQDSAFDNCYNITDVYYEGTEKDWESITFGYNNSSLLRATIHFGASADDIVEEETTMPDISVEYTTIVYPESTTMIPTTSVYPEETTIPVALSGVCGDNLTWSLDIETGILTIDGTGPMWEITKDFVSWKSSYYYSNYISAVYISDGVTSVSAYAFSTIHSLKNVTISDTVKIIGDYAFFKCPNIKEITIPASVTNIGKSVFGGCYNLVTINVDKNNNYYVNDSSYALYNRNKTELIHYPNGNQMSFYKIPDGVITISEHAFSYNHSLKDILIPASVTTIEDFAFCYCDIFNNVYYTGTQEQWENMFIGKSNEAFSKAEIHFNASESDLQNTTTLVYTTEQSSKPDGYLTTTVKYPATTCATTAKYPTAETTMKVPSTTKKPAETTTTTTRVAETTTATKPSESMHTHTSQLIVIPATCTVNGMKYTVCRDCGEPIGETTILQAKGHSAGEWLTVVEPTTESVGKQVRNCTICGEKVDEREIPKLSTVVDKKTGVEMNFNSADYDGEVEIVVKEVFDGKAFDVVDTSVISSQKFIYDITMTVDGSETQPEGKVTIRIPLPEGYDSAKTFVYHVDSSTGKIEKMQAEYVDGYLVFETTHFSYYAVVESADISMKIRQPSTTTVNYGETLVLHADLGGKTLPDGYKIKWFTNNDGVTIKSGNNGTTCEVTSIKNGSVTVTARIVDKNGNEVKGADGKEISASQTIESKVSIWLRIVSFFKNLFGSNRIIAQTILGK